MVYYVLTPRCFAYRHAATTFYQLQRGFGGQEATCADPGIFVSLIKSSAYFTVYRGGPMVLLLRKLYLYFTKDPEGVHYFPGEVSNFFEGGGFKC